MCTYFIDFREKMNKIGSNGQGKLEGTKRPPSPACTNACTAIIINDNVENNNNNNNNNSDNNDMRKKGKT